MYLPIKLNQELRVVGKMVGKAKKPHQKHSQITNL